MAAETGDVDAVSYHLNHLKNPADMNVQNGEGWTVLMYPSFEGEATKRSLASLTFTRFLREAQI